MPAVASIRVAATDAASAVIRHITKNLSDLGMAPSLDLGNLLGTGLGKLEEIGQAAWELGELGAQSLRTRAAFDELAAGAGISGQSMLRAMREASAGTVADSELMAAANRALVLDVADSAEEMAQLTAAAITRGRQVGVGAAQAVSDLINGIGRMSPEILDNLGIANAKGAFDEYAATLGTTADKLTDVQKKQALVNAVLQSAPGGAVVEDAAASFERMNASIQNAKKALGELFGPAVAAVAEAIARGAQIGLGALDVPTTDLETKLADLEGQALKWRDVWSRSFGAGEEDQFAATQVAGFTRLQRAMELANVALEQGEPQAKAWQAAVAGIAQQALEAGSLTEAQAAATAQLAAQLTAATAAIEFTGSAYDTIAPKVDAVTRKLLDQAAAAHAAVMAAQEATGSQISGSLLGMAGEMGAGRALALDKELNKELAERTRLMESWHYDEKKIQYENAAWLQQEMDGLREQTRLTGEATKAQQAYGSAVGSTAGAYDELGSKVQGAVSSLLQQSLTLDVDWPGKDAGLNGGGSGDAINENAKRLAAIANEGLIGQGWLDEFAAEAPSTYADLMLKIAEGMDAQGAAQYLLGEFQAGMRPDLLDFGQLKEQVKQQLLGEQALASMADQLTAELLADPALAGLGLSAGQVQGALAGVLGQSPGGAALAEGLDLGGTGDEAGGSLRGGIVAGFEADGMALEVLAKIDAEFASEKKAVEDSGKGVGAVWGGGFMSTVGNNIPVGLLDLFTAKLLPMILAGLAAQGSRTGAE